MDEHSTDSSVARSTEGAECCAKCSQLCLIASTNNTDGSKSVKVEASADELIQSACKICCMIGSIMSEHLKEVPELRHPTVTWFQVRGIPYARFDFTYNQAPRRKFHNSLVVFVANSSSLLEKQLDKYAQYVDFELARSWLEDSQKTTIQARNDWASLPRGMRLIDCKTRIVIEAVETVPFVALSYTWGAVQYVVGGLTLPERLPPTIEDSITMTLKMGHRYLWIDQFCINQKDAQHKHSQIRHLDAIYASAEVTLIAAAGNDALHGLPGVSRPRPAISHAVVNNSVHFLKFPPPAGKSIAHSTWFERAWTLQEGYLSRKRLYFTDNELVFNHGRIWKRDSPGQHYDCFEALRDSLPDTYASYASSQLNIAVWSIEQYTKRQLRYDSDALNAVLGILRHIHFLDDTLRSTWGVPYDTGSLCIYWFHDEPAERRCGFPSWSPLGWKGEAEFCNSHYWLHGGEPLLSRDMEMMSHDDEAVEKSKLLRIEVHLMMHSVVHEDDGVSLLSFENTFQEQVFRLQLPIRWDTMDPELRRSEVFPCAVFPGYDDSVRNVPVMVLKQKDEVYERVGFTMFEEAPSAHDVVDEYALAHFRDERVTIARALGVRDNTKQIIVLQ